MKLVNDFNLGSLFPLLMGNIRGLKASGAIPWNCQSLFIPHRLFNQKRENPFRSCRDTSNQQAMGTACGDGAGDGDRSHVRDAKTRPAYFGINKKTPDV